MQRPTRTPRTASYPTLMCSFRWPLRQGYMAPSGGETGTGDWKPTLQRCQGVHLPVPAAVRSTTEGECGLISKHFQRHRCNPLFHQFPMGKWKI